MKKAAVVVLVAVLALTCACACACGHSDAPVVGTYKLVSVTMSGGTVLSPTIVTYVVGGDNPLINEDCFVLTIKSNYRWNMTIMLPNVDEHESGKWVDEDGKYSLKEDKDDPVIPLTYLQATNTINMTLSEDGYLMSVTLKKA